MDIINNNLDLNLTEDKLIEVGTIFIKNRVLNIEKVLKCLNQMIKKGKDITVENLTIYRLESLLRVITTKKNMLERIKAYENCTEDNNDLLTQLCKYTIEVNLLIKELLKTNQIQSKCCGNADCEIEWK